MSRPRGAKVGRGGKTNKGKWQTYLFTKNLLLFLEGGKKGGAVFVSCDLQSTSPVRKAQLNLFVLQEKKYSCTCLTIPYDMLVEFAERKY